MTPLKTCCWLGAALLVSAMSTGCASGQKPAPTAEAVRQGDALPPAPPAPAPPVQSASSTAQAVPGGAAAVQSPPPEPPPAPEALSEPQIAKVSEVVNSAEVEQGKLAQAKAKATAVRSFAAMMVEHHGEALAEQARLVKRLRLIPADSATAAALQADSERTLATLEKTDAASFDAAYVSSQIEGHQKVLDLLDTQLLPAATTPEVAGALRKARTIVEQHLQRARALQAR